MREPKESEIILPVVAQYLNSKNDFKEKAKTGRNFFNKNIVVPDIMTPSIYGDATSELFSKNSNLVKFKHFLLD